ncbi:MerR family transcriptional regulator [Cohnella ginsengisoli]|uniref:MerR family transcriptional regulator n=1 Tax=Cohnella ginsengisoli TaxID=425004 RepID=A0A9X4KMT5_9BACL|nr:MerR family transcriptional regulator [Cohnella ginsengisoli]MDG0795177.1 MerR family transcriptional regulator [Cohnella ginsengisoli]
MGDNYSIRQVSNLLCIPKDSLRYYDKLGLVSPKRGENNYRYYDDQDLIDLRYIEVMKFCGFSLSEIHELFQLKRKPDERNHPVFIRILAEKEQILDKKDCYPSICQAIFRANARSHAAEKRDGRCSEGRSISFRNLHDTSRKRRNVTINKGKR